MLGRLILAATCLGSWAAIASASGDERALRYYAAHGETTRVAAEARRLAKLDPDWRLPTDLDTAQPAPDDEAPLWEMLRRGDLDVVDRAIAQRRSSEPGWSPAPALVTTMQARRLRAAVVALAKAGKWTDVLSRIEQPGLDWARDDAEALWTIAEAYARTRRYDEACAIYRRLLATHRDRKERIATIEFALPLLPMSLAETLVAMGGTDAAGKSEFEPIALDITRARLSAALHGDAADAITPRALADFEAKARRDTTAGDAGLLGWFAYQRREDARALDWFNLAIARGGDAMVAHGLAHTLRRLGRSREAEEVAHAWREPLVNNSILFIDVLETDLTSADPPVIEPGRLARYAEETVATQSGEGAQGLAWYAYNTCRYTTALQWFERAVAWLPKEATVYGYALTLQRLRRAKDFRDVVNRADGLFPSVVGLAFDDGLRQSRPRCEAKSAEAREPDATRPDWTGRAASATFGAVRWQGADAPAMPTPLSAASRGRSAPSPHAMRKRTMFPIAVPPENPLRFPAEPAGHDRPAPSVPLEAPKIARRVPGVGAMPYERYGFGLSPGYDGTQAPSSPTAREHDAPSGTLWRLETAPSQTRNAETGAAAPATVAGGLQ